MARSTGALATEAGTVHPHFYAAAQVIEDRLIRLIDGGEDLADWYPRPDLRGLVKPFRVRLAVAE